MDDRMFRLMLDWFMVSDPWPLSRNDQRLVELALGVESQNRGYMDWIDAYHEFGRREGREEQ